MTFLADTFRDLANDPSWPWHVDESLYYSVRNKLGGRVAHIDHDEYATIAQSPLTMARLAIMVIEQKHKWTPDEVKHFEQIKKNYAKVKKRVEEADTEP